MMLQYLRQKLRLFRFDRKKKKTGGIYHHHFHEIVVTKEELSIQLHIANNHDNLLKLLIYGKSLRDYDVRLTRAALKFAFLGSLVYPEGDGKTNKPKSSVYVYRLFQEGSETFDEVKDRISLITQQTVSDESARKIFRKLVFVINTCCPIMADVSEIWWEDTYRHLIEYAVENDEFCIPDGDSTLKLYPGDVPRCQTLSYVLAKLPDALSQKIINEEFIEDHIMF